jgi:hypothetical protein
MLPPSTFLPYVYIFFDRLFPVFPVVDKESLLVLLESEQQQEQPLPANIYSFLAAVSAAVITQLNLTESVNSKIHTLTTDHGEMEILPNFNSLTAFSAQAFVAQCLQARQRSGFIEEPDEWTILTSFFLFAYHGNLNHSRSAWYYLQEAIGFIQALGLDKTQTYTKLDTETGQRQRRIFWLLFVTERSVVSI